jgi:hypothetical protein
MINQLIKNDTTYTTHQVIIKNTKWNIMVVEGKFNYISVQKVITGMRTMAKDFKTFDEATKNYKNAELKLALLKIELNIA